MSGGLILGASALATVLAALGAYLAAARKLSGRIRTSDATELWEESRAIRDDYRQQLLEANKRTVSLEMRAAKLEHDNNELQRKNAALSAKVSRIDALERENAELRRQIAELFEAFPHLKESAHDF